MEWECTVAVHCSETAYYGFCGNEITSDLLLSVKITAETTTLYSDLVSSRKEKQEQKRH